jgi:hypothetical protein
MKATALLLSLLILPLLLTAAAAQAGVISGGGGGAYVCRDKVSGAVRSSELVDLFEARSNNIKVKYDNVTPVKKQVEAAIGKLEIIAPAFGHQVREAWAYVYSHRAGGAGVKVDDPQDVDKHYSKEGCRLTGMMYFDDRRGNLIINPLIFNKQKTKTDFAASYLHEAIYKVMRDNSLPGGRDSVMTRILVGCLVADQDAGECLRLHKTALPKGHDVWNCSVIGDGGVAVSFFLSGASSGEAFQVILAKVGDTTFKYQTVLQFEKQIQTLPDFSPDSHGDVYNLKDAKILSLEDLGNPVGEDLLSTIEIPREITKGSPITILVNGSGQKYTCKGN